MIWWCMVMMLLVWPGTRDGRAQHLWVLREGLDGGAAVDGRRLEYEDHGQESGVLVIFAGPRVDESDGLVARGAEEAPVCVAPAAQVVVAQEGIGELQDTAHAAVEAGALRDGRNAGDLLHCAGEGSDRGGVEVAPLAKTMVAVLRISAQQAVERVVLQ